MTEPAEHHAQIALESGSYQRRPTCIDAIRMTDAVLYSSRIEQTAILPAWVFAAFDCGDVAANCFEGEVVGFVVETGGGSVAAPTDDWLARGREGELYPIKASVFAATYERDDTAPSTDISEPVSALSYETRAELRRLLYRFNKATETHAVDKHYDLDNVFAAVDAGRELAGAVRRMLGGGS